MGTPLVDAVRRVCVVVLVALLGALALSPPHPAHAAPGDPPTLQLVPGSVAPAPGEVVQVAVVLDNATDTALTVRGLRFLTPPRITVSAPTDLPAELAPGSSYVAVVQVSTSPGAGEASVGILAEVTDASGTARSVSSSLTVSPGASTAPEASFVVFPTGVLDGDSRRATLRVTNPTSATFQELQLAAVDGDDAFLVIAPSPATRDCADDGSGRLIACLDGLAPGASHLVDLEVRTLGSVRTGTQQVGVVVVASLDDAAGRTPTQVSTVVMHDVEIRVFGVDALSPFGVGVLFLLPGLLAIVVFLAAMRWVYPRVRSKALPDKVDPKDLSQMPIVVIVGVAAYLLVWLVWREDLTRRTSTLAVLLLFAVGIAFGLVAWGITAGLYRQLVGRRRFRLRSEPAQVLRALAHRDAGLTFPSYRKGEDTYLYLGSSDGKEFGAPQIGFDLSRASDADDVRFHRARTVGDIDTILELQQAGAVSLDWWKQAAGPEAYDPAELPALGEQRGLLREAT